MSCLRGRRGANNSPGTQRATRGALSRGDKSTHLRDRGGSGGDGGSRGDAPRPSGAEQGGGVKGIGAVHGGKSLLVMPGWDTGVPALPRALQQDFRLPGGPGRLEGHPKSWQAVPSCGWPRGDKGAAGAYRRPARCPQRCAALIRGWETARRGDGGGQAAGRRGDRLRGRRAGQ